MDREDIHDQARTRLAVVGHWLRPWSQVRRRSASVGSKQQAAAGVRARHRAARELPILSDREGGKIRRDHRRRAPFRACHPHPARGGDSRRGPSTASARTRPSWRCSARRIPPAPRCVMARASAYEGDCRVSLAYAGVARLRQRNQQRIRPQCARGGIDGSRARWRGSRLGDDHVNAVRES